MLTRMVHGEALLKPEKIRIYDKLTGFLNISNFALPHFQLTDISSISCPGCLLLKSCMTKASLSAFKCPAQPVLLQDNVPILRCLYFTVAYALMLAGLLSYLWRIHWFLLLKMPNGKIFSKHHTYQSVITMFPVKLKVIISVFLETYELPVSQYSIQENQTYFNRSFLNTHRAQQ
jgi:hypothetical protein